MPGPTLLRTGVLRSQTSVPPWPATARARYLPPDAAMPWAHAH